MNSRHFTAFDEGLLHAFTIIAQADVAKSTIPLVCGHELICLNTGLL